MITKYLALKYSYRPTIQAVQVEKETKQSVWIDGRRSAKQTTYENYFDSFDDAKNFLAKLADDKLISARRQLEAARGFAGNVRGLKAP